MKIDEENGMTSPGVSTSSADEMIEAENQTMRDRMGYLERKVVEQNDEMMCLRSTLADALRRINNLEGSKGTSVRQGNRTPTNKDGTGIRLRGFASDTPSNKRNSSYIPSRTSSSTPSSARGNRKSRHYQSTSSLYSDGHSSSSASPVPSPSPTGGNNGHSHQLHISSPATPIYQQRAASRNQPSSSFASPTHKPQQSLNKRWASTSDFSPNGMNSHIPSSVYHSPLHSNNSVPLSHNNRTASTTGSLHNLSNLRMSNPALNITRQGREAQYNSEEGIVKMYLRGRPLNLFVPSSHRDSYSPQAQSALPGAKLKLDWVYGYRGRDCRTNVNFLPTGEIVYFVSAVVVLFNVEEHTQRHYLGHTDDVKCMAIHPNKMTIATGQSAGHDRKDSRSWRLNPPTDAFCSEAEEWPHIRVWDSVSLTTLHIIGIGDIERSVACLAFSKADGGGLLAAVDEAPDHNLSVWDWSRGERGFKLMETKCAADQVLSCEFSPVDKNTIISCGKNQIIFWTYENGMMAKRVGIFENRERPKYVTAIAFTDTGNVISGDSNGNLLVWQRGGNRVERSIRNVHEGAVFTIFVQKDGAILSGGKDGKLIERGRDLQLTGRVLQVPDHLGSPRVVVSGRGSQLIIGTTRNSIMSGNFTLPLQVVMQSHTDEIWALAPHPSQNQFLTAGYDKCCYLWDSMSRSVVWTKEIGEAVQSCTFSPNGDLILVGTCNGRWVVMDAETRETYSQYQDGTEPLQIMSFSPDGKMLAIGSRDSQIYIYQVSLKFRKYSRLGRCQGHSNFVSHLDWSKDSLFLRSNSADYELLYWNPHLCRPVPAQSQMRDTQWASQTCSLSFETLGVWPSEGADGTDINSVCAANHKALLATGDNFGRLRLFANPACQQKARFSESLGHSTHITSVNFLHNDSRLISTGGKDTAIMQWSINLSRF